MNQPRVKRALIGDFPCTPGAVKQVHPHAAGSPASRELFVELDHLRAQLRESKERELLLQAELRRLRDSSSDSELEKELEAKKRELDALARRVGVLETEKAAASIRNQQADPPPSSTAESLEMEVVKLRRLNMELQLQKRSLAFQLASVESKLASLSGDLQGDDIVAKVQAEASVLRHTNASLSKQVEGLQMSRLTEVEEIAYLRWINSCLRRELCSSGDQSSAEAIDLQYHNDDEEDAQPGPTALGDAARSILDARRACAASRRHSIGGASPEAARDAVDACRRQSDSFSGNSCLRHEVLSFQISHVSMEKHDTVDEQRPKLPTSGKKEAHRIPDGERRAVRIPNPPPRPSACSVPSADAVSQTAPRPPPPPPPPPKFLARGSGVMKRAPQVAELYHSLMKRDSRREPSGGSAGDAQSTADVRSSMIGEIENRSSHLLAIKADVATQGEFVKSLIREVNGAVFQDIEHVVAFVKWLDDELGFLVDERAVLKHFDWPERKADMLREAAFGYLDLKRLESELSNYKDDPRLPCEPTLKKIACLLEKAERSVYNLLRVRDGMMRQCKDFGIPTEWMLDSNLICKIKFASVKLAKKYMKRVAAELQTVGALSKDPALEYMLLQGVRFAFRVHQFAGGFDTETMDAFDELRNLVYVRHSSHSEI